MDELEDSDSRCWLQLWRHKNGKGNQTEEFIPWYLDTVIETQLQDLEPDAKNQMQEEAAKNAQLDADSYFDEES